MTDENFLTNSFFCTRETLYYSKGKHLFYSPYPQIEYQTEKRLVIHGIKVMGISNHARATPNLFLLSVIWPVFSTPSVKENPQSQNHNFHTHQRVSPYTKC